MDILASLPAIMFGVVIIGFLVFTGIRLGLPFLVRRLAGLVFVLFATSFITFTLGYFAPSSAVEAQLGDKYTPAKAALLKHYYGLDQPFFVQYGAFLNRIVHFNLGESFLLRGRSVWVIITSQLPRSALLGLSAIIIAVIVGVSTGLFAAIHANTRYDTVVQGFALFFFALPTFVIIPIYQVLMVILYNNNLPHLPISSTEFGLDHLDQVIAPVLIFSAVQIAFYVRLTRTSTLEVLRQDYVRTAKAKGISNQSVIWKHTFRNAMIPLVTALGPALAYIVNGAFITEALFNIQGLGTTVLNAITQNDFPVLQGTVILLATAVAFMNLATDVAYGVIDPRIKST